MINMATVDESEVRNQVRETYAEAAQQAKGLCCPKQMPADFVRHIPSEAFEHSYGCGSPIVQAGVNPGDVVADLGCGVGIDCFVAAKLVGKTGRVVGIDMTDAMLSRAYGFNARVSKNLGYEVVEFRKGVMEKLPLDDGSVDLLVSNCVLNLSTDKQTVFKEIFRVLRQGGRFVVSDIVSDRDILPQDSADPSEWAECTVGTLSLQAFLAEIKNAGFVGITQLSEDAWREVKGYHLGSVTIEASKYQTDCHASVGHLAIYLGPYAEVRDDLGNVFSRFKPTAIRDDVARVLERGRHASSFILIEGRPAARGKQERKASPCCDPSDKATPCCEGNEPKADGSPCCDPYAAQQPADCSCNATTEASPPAQAQSSGCCDSTSGCGPASGCGDSRSAPTGSRKTDAGECCDCEVEAQATGSECCGSGCGTCGCD